METPKKKPDRTKNFDFVIEREVKIKLKQSN